MRPIISTIIFFILTSLANGQIDSMSDYKNLKSQKFYAVGLQSESGNGKKETYKVNGKTVSKSTFNKYKSTWDNMLDCCPCILKSYDENDILLSESVSCTDCGVGWFKIFYENGKLKLTGSYKENTTGNWDDIWNRGYCSVPHGKWTYYNDKGDSLYSEYWNNGVFVNQVPEQALVEIWNVKITLNGQDVDSLSIPIANVGDLIIAPQFKNSNTNTNLTLSFEVSAIGHVSNKKDFTIESFKKINVNDMLLEVGIPKEKKTNYYLVVYDNGKVIKRISLTIVK